MTTKKIQLHLDEKKVLKNLLESWEYVLDIRSSEWVDVAVDEIRKKIKVEIDQIVSRVADIHVVTIQKNKIIIEIDIKSLKGE